MWTDTRTPFALRWWSALLAGAVLGATVGYACAAVITATYEGRTQLLVGPLNTTADLDASGALAGTYAQLGQSRPVLASAIRRTHAPLTPAKLGAATSIESNQITRIIAVRVRDSDPRRAARLANALAGRLVELSSRRRALASSGAGALNREPAVTRLPERARRSLHSAVGRLFSGSAGRLRITDRATAPDVPVKPSIPLVVFVGALVGVLLAALLAIAWDSVTSDSAGDLTWGVTRRVGE